MAAEKAMLLPLITHAHPEIAFGVKTGNDSTQSRTFLVLKALLVLVALWIFDYCFHNPFCNAMYRCGCTWNWDGGWAKCNVHNATGPKCPWCAAEPILQLLVLDNTVIAISFVAYLYVSKNNGYAGLKQFVAPLATWLLYNFSMGVLFFVFSDYPWFLWFSKP